MGRGTKTIVWGLFFSIFACANGASSDLSDAGSGGTDGGGSSDSSSIATDAADGSVRITSDKCERDIQFGNVTVSDPSCYTNESVANAKGTIVYSCGAGGPVLVTFGTQVFTGNIVGSNVTLQNVETFQFPSEPDPRCRWESTQFIGGDLDSGPLTYKYSERVLTPGYCQAFPCQTTGKLTVTDVSKERPAE